MTFRRLLEYAAVVVVADLVLFYYLLPKSAPLIIERATAPGPSTLDYSRILRVADEAIATSISLSQSSTFSSLQDVFSRLTK